MLRTLRPVALAATLIGAAQAQSTSTPLVAPAPTLSTVGPGQVSGLVTGCPGQELYVMTIRGKLFRIDDYSVGPVAVQVADLGLLWITDIAFDPLTADVYGIQWGLATASGYDELFRLEAPGYTTRTVIASSDPLSANPIPSAQNALDFSAGGALYSRGSGPAGRDLFMVDKVTGAYSLLAATSVGTAGDVAVDMNGAVLSATAANQNPSAQRIDRWDPVNGVVDLGPHGLGNGLYGLEVDCLGTVYALNSTGDLYTLDISVPMAITSTAIANIGLPINEPVLGMAFLVPADGFGASYCGPAVTNSTGRPGVIETYGSSAAADDDLTLLARDLPPNQFAYFLASQSQGFIASPGGAQGNLCMGSNIARYNAFTGQISAAGLYSAAVGTSVAPTNPPQAIVAGQTWNFQCWYRDANPAATSNFTDAIEVLFN